MFPPWCAESAVAIAIVVDADAAWAWTGFLPSFELSECSGLKSLCYPELHEGLTAEHRRAFLWDDVYRSPLRLLQLWESLHRESAVTSTA
jgi:hypothetical protein